MTDSLGKAVLALAQSSRKHGLHQWQLHFSKEFKMIIVVYKGYNTTEKAMYRRRGNEPSK